MLVMNIPMFHALPFTMLCEVTRQFAAYKIALSNRVCYNAHGFKRTFTWGSLTASLNSIRGIYPFEQILEGEKLSHANTQTRT